VQGQDAPASIAAALKTIGQQANYFDAVLLLRGGGSRLDLMAFDQWMVCEAIARMPIPVLTGIGHETDATLADQVAFRALRTPTAAATFILQHNEFFEINMAGLMADLAQCAQQNIITHSQNLQRDRAALQWSSAQQLRTAQQQLTFVQQTLPVLANHQISHFHQLLHTAQVTFEALHPDTTMKRGYAMVTRGEQLIGSASDAAPGDALNIHFVDGTVPVKVGDV
jgi:exodeoxyribonuclease VII large subunit